MLEEVLQSGDASPPELSELSDEALVLGLSPRYLAVGVSSSRFIVSAPYTRRLPTLGVVVNSVSLYL